MKYPINREFFPLTLFTPPTGRWTIHMAQKYMKVPGFIWKDPDITAESRKIPGYENGEIELLILTPKNISASAPALIHIHGGGFVFDAWRNHYKLALAYAKGAGCRVIFVRYRLAPDHPFPIPHEDCYAALCWVFDHAEELDTDRNRIGITGDSAGGTLTVTSCMMARDRRSEIHPLFQLIVYPWLDNRGNSESNMKYTDTPLWNSSLSGAVTEYTQSDKADMPLAYLSPVEAESVENLPPAYIEVAEFDCLHDDGILYAEKLKEAGIEVELHETKGTLHGFDTKFSAPTTQKMLALRIEYMKKLFG